MLKNKNYIKAERSKMSNENFIIDITNQIEATVDIYPKLLDGSITNEELKEAIEQKKIRRFGRWCSGE